MSVSNYKTETAIRLKRQLLFGALKLYLSFYARASSGTNSTTQVKTAYMGLSEHVHLVSKIRFNIPVRNKETLFHSSPKNLDRGQNLNKQELNSTDRSYLRCTVINTLRTSTVVSATLIWSTLLADLTI